MDKSAYTSASTLPSKLFSNNIIQDGKIVPIHIQVYPTNACNLKCGFCSVRDIDKHKFIPFDLLMSTMNECVDRGTKAVTISGGGEPMTYYKINEFIRELGYGNIQAGLTTNGILLEKLAPHPNLTWARISCSDEREPAYSTIEKALKVNPRTDWAFSYVVTTNPDFDRLNKAIEFANKNNFTHVRVVNDLMDEDSPEMDRIERNIKVPDERVIYQGRKQWARGSDCYMHLLKPVIAPEGVIRCCGGQYSVAGSEGHYHPSMIVGRLEDIASILDSQIPLDGNKVCDKCFYGDYNQVLRGMKTTPKHNSFV
jgi:organic radical activating enzyme